MARGTKPTKESRKKTKKGGKPTAPRKRTRVITPKKKK